MSKVRKAIAAGFAAGATAAGGAFLAGGDMTTKRIGELLGLFVGGFFVGFVTTYAAPANAPQR